MWCSRAACMRQAFTCRRTWPARPPTRRRAASSTSTTMAPSRNDVNPAGTSATGRKPPLKTTRMSWTPPWGTLRALSRSLSWKWLDLDYKRLVNNDTHVLLFYLFIFSFSIIRLKPCRREFFWGWEI